MLKTEKKIKRKKKSYNNRRLFKISGRHAPPWSPTSVPNLAIYKFIYNAKSNPYSYEA